MEWALAIFLGLGLAASCGLNTFLPLLCLSAAAHFHLFGVQLGSSFAWLASPGALAALSVASVIEMIGDKVPAVDHFLDVLGTVARPAAGTLAASSVLGVVGLGDHGDATTAAIIGLILGAPPALGVHAAKASTRAASSVATLGVANPVLSTIEDALAVGLSVLALAAPILVPFAQAALSYSMWKLWRFVRARRKATADGDALPMQGAGSAV